jgi:hypothetical protein
VGEHDPVTDGWTPSIPVSVFYFFEGEDLSPVGMQNFEKGFKKRFIENG